MKSIHEVTSLLILRRKPLLLLYCTLILAGTLFPFNFTADWELLSQRPVPIEWIPFSYVCPHCGFDIQDKTLNALMLIPFGFLLAPLFVGPFSKSRALLLVTFSGFAFSLAIEAAQLFLPMRIPSASDLVLNTAGAFLGACLAVVIGQGKRLRK